MAFYRCRGNSSIIRVTAFVHFLSQQLLVVNHPVDAVLRPPAPDDAVGVRVDDVEHDRPLLHTR
jgi:hypothetical protein